MNDAILIQQAYPGVEFPAMIELQRARNVEYCQRHDFDAQIVIQQLFPEWPIAAGAWEKVELIRQALDAGYQYVAWIDADALIWDTSVDLRTANPAGIGACWHRIPQLHHWNVGVMYFRNTQPVREFVVDWLRCYPGDGDGWNEQGVFNRMGRKSPIVETLSDRWNATVNTSMVPDPVVMGFHGVGTPAQRLALMRKALESR